MTCTTECKNILESGKVCGQKNPVNFRFCTGCGAALSAGSMCFGSEAAGRFFIEGNFFDTAKIMLWCGHLLVFNKTGRVAVYDDNLQFVHEKKIMDDIKDIVFSGEELSFYILNSNGVYRVSDRFILNSSPAEAVPVSENRGERLFDGGEELYLVAGSRLIRLKDKAIAEAGSQIIDVKACRDFIMCGSGGKLSFFDKKLKKAGELASDYKQYKSFDLFDGHFYGIKDNRVYEYKIDSGSGLRAVCEVNGAKSLVCRDLVFSWSEKGLGYFNIVHYGLNNLLNMGSVVSDPLINENLAVFPQHEPAGNTYLFCYYNKGSVLTRKDLMEHRYSRVIFSYPYTLLYTCAGNRIAAALIYG